MKSWAGGQPGWLDTNPSPQSAGATSAIVSENVHEVTRWIEAGVLALAIREVFGFLDDPGAVPASARHVRVHRLDPDHHRMSASERRLREIVLGDDDRAAVEFKLRAVGSDAQSDVKAKRFLQPPQRRGNVTIFEDRDDRRSRHRKVWSHPTSSARISEFCIGNVTSS